MFVRLDELFTAVPIPFRRQNASEYAIPALTLRDDIAPGRSGFAVHVAKADEQDQQPAPVRLASAANGGR